MQRCKKLRPKAALLCILIIAIYGLFYAQVSNANASKSSIIPIDTISAIKPRLDMPAAVFDHNKHTKEMSKRGLDCSVCHQVTTDNKNEASWNFKNIVFQKGDSPSKLEQSYHDACIGCHIDWNDGPRTAQCRECHTQVSPITTQSPDFAGKLHLAHIQSENIPPLISEAKSNCGTCHHSYVSGDQKAAWLAGQEEPCFVCHKTNPVKQGNVLIPDLKTASHDSCVSCHYQMAIENNVFGQGKEKDQGKTIHIVTAMPKKDLLLNAKAPLTCKGCHEWKALSFVTEPPLPRLDRGQPDIAIIEPIFNSPPAEQGAGEKAVVFNHKIHENAIASCSSCHHQGISACSYCHTVEGKAEGNFVQQSSSMHQPDSKRSCVGCHNNMVSQNQDCAGCHSLLPKEKSVERACTTCHSGLGISTDMGTETIVEGIIEIGEPKKISQDKPCTFPCFANHTSPCTIIDNANTQSTPCPILTNGQENTVQVQALSEKNVQSEKSEPAWLTSGNISAISPRQAKTTNMMVGESKLNMVRPQVKPLNPEDIPEFVEISYLSNTYKPSNFPHRKIYAALLNNIKDNKLASVFHSSSLAVCGACHHNSVSSLTPPTCRSCHSSEKAQPNRPSLQAAYHQQCMTCHAAMNMVSPAATDCTACHAENIKGAK